MPALQRPKFSIEEIRRVEIKLWGDDEDDALKPVKSVSAVEDGRTHLRLDPGGPGRDLKVEFDLQSPGQRPNGKPMKALKDAGVSFRTPNIEVEVRPILACVASSEPDCAAAVHHLGHPAADRPTVLLLPPVPAPGPRGRPRRADAVRRCDGHVVNVPAPRLNPTRRRWTSRLQRGVNLICAEVPFWNCDHVVCVARSLWRRTTPSSVGRSALGFGRAEGCPFTPPRTTTPYLTTPLRWQP